MNIERNATAVAGSRTMLIVAAGLILAGCAPMQSHQLARTTSKVDYLVTVNFNTNGCPVSVSPPATTCVSGTGFCVGRAKSIKWASSPEGNAFQIYFDPFVGRPYSSHGPNEATAPVIIRRDTLLGEYKYGVFGVNCKGSEADAVLDPPLRVDH